LRLFLETFTMNKTIFLLLFVISFGLLQLRAQNSQSRLAAVDYSKYEQNDIVTLYDSTRVMMEESGLSHIYNHRLYRIMTPAGGRDYNTVKVDYDPLSAYAEIREVIIYRKNGTVEKLDAYEVDYPAPAYLIYWGARQKMVTIGRLEPGDAVEFFTYKKGFTYALLQDEDPDAKYIPPMRGHFYDIVPFWSSQPIIQKVYQVSVLTNKNLRYKVYNGTLEMKTRSEKDRTIYTFVKKDITPIPIPSNTLAHNDIETKLLLSTAKDWESKSTWFYGVNEDYGSFIPTDEVKLKVAGLLKSAKSENDSISILTHWVADNMRYSGISMGTGEGFTLHKCEMNYTDRCGVCKDKAGMLIAMLRVAGFKAYAAMTMAGERIDDIPADQFNHCVTVVQRRNGNYQLLDPTWVPGVRELWSSREQQQNFLMGLPQGATLGITPISKPDRHPINMSARTRLSKNGTLSGTVTITADGQSDAAIRRLFRANRVLWQEVVEKQFFSLYPNAKLFYVRYSNEDTYLNHPVTIVYKFSIPQYATVGEKAIVVTPLLAKGLFMFAMPHLYFNTTPETRDYPFSDQCSRLITITETMSVPAGYATYSCPKTDNFQSEYLGFQGGYKVSNNIIEFSETIRLGKRVYEASDWPEFRKAILNQKHYMNTPVIIENK